VDLRAKNSKMLPPWKQALLEKKRRQEEEDKKRFEDEQSKLSVMPVWKREILKKRQQKNSLVFLAKRSPGNDVNGVSKRQEFSEGVVAVETFPVSEEDLENPEDLLTKVVLNHKRPDEDQVSLQGPIEEHVRPVQQNPWLVTDTLRKKKQKPRTSSGGSVGNYKGGGGGTNHVICDRDTDGRYEQQSGDDIITNDSVFGEDLPEYGRGFVHKLRSRFSTLSDRDKRAGATGDRQRSQSSDSLLDDSLKTSPRGCLQSNDGYVFQSSLYGSQKAHSMESLLGDPPAPIGSPRRRVQDRATHDDDVQYGGDRRNSLEMPPHENSQPGIDDPEVLPRPNTVSAARSLFETPSPLKRDKSLESPRADFNDFQSETADNYTRHSMQNGSGSPYSHSQKGGNTASEDTIRSIRDVGKVVYSTDGEVLETLSPRSPSQGDHVNDRNANYTSHTEEGEAAAAVTSQRHSPGYNNRMTSGSSLSPSAMVGRSVFNNDVAQRNQNNNLLSSQRHVNGAAPEVISTDPDSTSPVSPLGYVSKKRPAPMPPQYTSPEDSKKHAGSDESSKTKLTLDLTNSKEAPQIFDESPSYRDLYFAGRKKDVGSPRGESSPSSPRDSAQTTTAPEASRPNHSISSYSNTGFQPTVQTKNRTAFTAEPSRKLSPADDAPRGFSARSPGVKYDAIRHVQGINDAIDAGSETSSVSSASHDTNLSNGWSSSSVTSVTSVDSPKREPVRTTTPNQRHSYHEGSYHEVSKPDHRHSEEVKAKEQPKVVQNAASVQSHVSQGQQEKAPSVTPRQASLDSNKPQVTLRQSPQSHDVTKRYTFPQSTPKESSPNKVERPNSIISNSGMSLADVTKQTKKDDVRKVDKKVKRQSGPGSLLIRPASNLLPAGAQSSVPFLNLNQYKDIKTGVFAEAPKRLSDDDYSDDDVPVTNIDDVLNDDIPVTNIDDVPVISSNRRELDADTLRKQGKKYDFIGGGVSLGRSLLEKTKAGKMKIQFNDAATSTYEYPSEQSLLEQLSPEERLEMERENAASSHDEGMNSDGEDSEMMVGGGLKSNPAIGAAGNLANYQAKYLPDYALGMQMNAEEPVVKRPEPQRPKNPDDVSIKPAEEDDTSTWSSSTTSDLLF